MEVMLIYFICFIVLLPCRKTEEKVFLQYDAGQDGISGNTAGLAVTR